MDIIKYLRDNLIIIVPQVIKGKIIQVISEQSEMFSIKVISDLELKNGLTFECNSSQYFYLSKYENVKIDVAKEMIQAMQLIDENKTYKSGKLNHLVVLKKMLIEKKVISYNDVFVSIFKGKDVLLYGFDVISKELSNLLKLTNANITIASNLNEQNENIKLYHFETLNDEVEALAIQISKLLQDGVDINKIKIANVNEEYLFAMKNYFKYFNIPVNFESDELLYDLRIVKDFINILKSENDYQKALDVFIDKYKMSFDIHSKLLNICNECITNTPSDAIDQLIYLLKNSKVTKEKYDKACEIVSIANNHFKKDEYLFILSLNVGQYPKSYKNEGYISDDECDELLIDTSDDKNIIAKKEFEAMLTKSCNIIMSYKLKSPFNSYNKSYILSDIGIKDETFKYDYRISYSKRQDMLNLAKYYDVLYMPSEDKYLSILNATYQIPYKAYDNQFSGISANKIKDYILKANIKMSYSSLNNYYQCGFKYYMNDILKLADPAPLNAVAIGNLFHEVLEKQDDENFDFDALYDSMSLKIDDISLQFYANRLKETLRNIIKINKENLKYSKLSKLLKEKEVNVIYNKPITIRFKGIIDKIMYTVENDTTYVAIIDYKTSNPDIDLNKVEFGLSMQLPIYTYLMKHTQEFKNVVIVGFYLQKLLLEGNKAGDDPIGALKESIKLQGYSNKEKSVLSKFDSTYEKSELIRSMSVTSSGEFKWNSKVLSSEEMDNLANVVEAKVLQAIDNICEGNFQINPKIYNGKNVSCDFCPFMSCCFKTYQNNVYLTLPNDGGDE